MRRTAQALVAVLLMHAVLEARGDIFDDIKNQWVPAVNDIRKQVQDAVKEAAGNADKGWDDFKRKFNNVSRDGVDDASRKAAFIANIIQMNANNIKNTNWFDKIGPLADLNVTMFKKLQTLQTPAATTDPVINTTLLPSGQLPNYVNWVEVGKVRPVRDQGSCGSCWSFATVATLETSNAIVYNTSQDLSPQQLIDCNVPQNGGCNGGFMEAAYRYLLPRNNNGSTWDANYPYKGREGSCNTAKEVQTVAFISNWTYIPPRNEEALMRAVSIGAVAVGIDASSIQNYGGGVYSDYSACSTTDINHAVTVVGYNKQDGWWLVRNSWGADWGENGYIRMAMGGPSSRGICGILTTPIMPLLAGQQSYDGPTSANGTYNAGGGGAAGAARRELWGLLLPGLLLLAALLS